MMERVKVRAWIETIGEQLHTEHMRKALTAAGSFLLGLICSRGLMFGKYAPFGIAAVAAAPRGGLWAGAMGAFLGYLLPSPVYVPARYAAALVAVTAIRWALSELKTVNSHQLFAPAAAFLPLLLTGMTMVFLNGSVSYTAALYVAESFLGAGSSFFLKRTANIITGLAGESREGPRSRTVFDTGDIAAVSVSVGIILLAFSDVSIMGVSVGRILLVLLVLCCARAGGIAGGAVAGVAAGAIQGLATAGLSYLSGAYGLGGLMAGVFAPMGAVATAAAFIISHGVASLQVGAGGTQIFTGSIEVAVATVAYMLIPRSRRLGELFGVRPDTLSGGALRGNIVMRLRYAAQALLSVSDSVDEISKKLSVVCAPNLQGVYNKSTETICAGCGMSGVCWRKYKDETLDNFAQLYRPLKEKERLETSDFTKEFSGRCCRVGEMRDEVNKNYARYLMKEAAELRAAQVREVVEGHFHTTAGILEEMAGEFSMYQRFDEEAAGRVAAILRESGVTPLEVCCRVDRFGRMTVEAEISRERQKRLNRAAFTREVSEACGRVFAPPCVSSAEDRCRIQMCQRPQLQIGRGFSQYCAGGGAFCGDSTNVFYDGCGRLIAVLSDGMGTGGRAAVDGAMTSAMAESLLKAGIGFDSMLETVNSALIAKSGDESLATMDVACIDLFSGKAEFFKAGAACTVLRRGRHSELIEASSVPVGIMPGVEFAEAEREVDVGDIVVMVSDGVVAAGSEWLIDLVMAWDEEENPNLLAQRITDEARRRRSDGHEDDVTALVLVVQ
ncbi:MAG: SpoIIE family protein phosphatase [Acutalibacter sp.]|jgi:stage II sporulation protein E|uniref:SpoIIE family protein phosphatase n=1 Tax=Acutalibacter sp. TaxID=1918636 RepID=UPI00216F05D9|nr:SpoIIE family protein phosphatase [Acutalibacter sp.]MCI9225565.1 SpoIIE family protein phosphatase [Acutalibacter sp.]